MSDTEQVIELNTTKVLDRTPTISIDPGLKNLGFAYGCIDTEQTSDKKMSIKLRFYENKVGSCSFIDSKTASSTYNVYLATKMFLSDLVGDVRHGKLDQAVYVIEKQYFNPTGTAKVGHHLCIIEQTFFTYFSVDENMKRGSICDSVDTRKVKNFFHGTAPLSRPNKKKQSIDIVKSLIRDENRRLAYQHLVDEHFADCILNLVWYLIEMKKASATPFQLDDFTVEILSTGETLPTVEKSHFADHLGNGSTAELGGDGTDGNDSPRVLDQLEAHDGESDGSTDS